MNETTQTASMTASLAEHLEELARAKAAAAARLRAITDRAGHYLTHTATGSVVCLFASTDKAAVNDAYATALRDIACHPEWVFDVEELGEKWALSARRPMYTVSGAFDEPIPASHSYIVQHLDGDLPVAIGEARECVFAGCGSSMKHTVTRTA